MIILSVNSGSSSLKFKLIQQPSFEELLAVELKKYNDKEIVVNTKIGNDENSEKKSIEFWDSRVEYLKECIEKVVSSSKITKTVHRIVHGGEKYLEPTELDNVVIKDLEENFNNLAPLHNPIALEVAQQIIKSFPLALHYGVFDTSFGKDVAPLNYLYALPEKYYQEAKIRRYSFHGISHKYISEIYHNHIYSDQESYPMLRTRNRNKKDIKIVSCHLGSGSSVCAIKGTRCVDSSFGFSPMENLVMSTRVGEIDYDAVIYLKSKYNLSDNEIENLLNKESGLLGVSEYSKDMKQLLSDMNVNIKAKLAVDMYVNSVVKYIHTLIATLGGIDVLIFTGGIGQGSDQIRERICERLGIFRIYMDAVLNKNRTDLKDILNITASVSEVDIFVIPTDEEKSMAIDVSNL